MISTGSLGLDIALGGGWRPGTLNEVWGDPGSAKTVLAKHSAESVVRAGKNVLWIDVNASVAHMDHAPRVIIGRPRNAEEAFAMAEEACRWPDIDLVILDPTQQLVRQREIDGDPGYVPHPQREYRLELNSLKGVAGRQGTTVLFVGQPRDKERQPVRGTGISEKVHWRVHLHPDVIHQDGSRVIQASVKDVPGKTSRHDVARFAVYPGKGIDQTRELVHAGISFGNIRQNGSWLRFGDLHCQGIDEMVFLLDQPGRHQLRHVLDTTVRAVAGIG